MKNTTRVLCTFSVATRVMTKNITKVINIPDAIEKAEVACSASTMTSETAETWGTIDEYTIHNHKIFCKNQNFWNISFISLSINKLKPRSFSHKRKKVKF